MNARRIVIALTFLAIGAGALWLLQVLASSPGCDTTALDIVNRTDSTTKLTLIDSRKKILWRGRIGPNETVTVQYYVMGKAFVTALAELDQVILSGEAGYHDGWLFTPDYSGSVVIENDRISYRQETDDQASAVDLRGLRYLGSCIVQPILNLTGAMVPQPL